MKNKRQAKILFKDFCRIKEIHHYSKNTKIISLLQIRDLKLLPKHLTIVQSNEYNVYLY